MHQSDILLGLQSDPFVTSVLIGVVWPLIQAALDRPYWTRQRRVWLTVAVAVVVTAGVWVSGSYPATWKLIVSPGGETIDDVRASAGEAVTRSDSGGETQS